MTDTDVRPELTAPPTAQPAPATQDPSLVRRLLNGSYRRWRGHRQTIAVVTALLAVVGTVQAYGMDRAPQRIDDEGTYVAQAYAVLHFGSLAPYTYFYDHPPLGWIQIAGYAWLTDAFDRVGAVAAGREAMLVAAIVSALLLWVLGRRLGLSRVGSGAAVLLFGLSPLAVQFHRSVYLDNVATPWMLAAFTLALSPRKRLVAFAGNGLCFGIAVLSKETFLLLLPALAWQLWRTAHASTRRYGWALSGSLLALSGFGYVLLALIKGELLPGHGHVSLLGGLTFQLAGRASSGSVFNSATLAHQVAAMWLQLDHVFPFAAIAAVPAAFLVRRLRPVALGLAILLLTMLRPGYLPVPFVIALIPLGALVVCGVLDAAVRWRPAGSGRMVARLRAHRVTARPLAVLALVATMTGAVAAGPAWASQLHGFVAADLDAPMRQAEGWVSTNVPRGDRLMVDDSMWVDLYRAGFPRSNVVWYYKVDTDPAVAALSPRGWRDYDYVISTNSLRTFPNVSPMVRTALANSVVVARFGSGVQRVEIRRVVAQGQVAAARTHAADLRTRAEAGRALSSNSQIAFGAPARAALRSGAVDPRLLVTLAALAEQHPISVPDLPALPGESLPADTRRTARISTAGPRGGAVLAAWFHAQPAPYRPATVTRSATAVTVTYPQPAPAGLLTPLLH